VQAAAHGIGLEPKADQIGGVEEIKGLLATQRHSSILSIHGLPSSGFGAGVGAGRGFFAVLEAGLDMPKLRRNK
jgi:hypothetical protein